MKKTVNNKPLFYKRDLIQIVCSSQKKIDTLYVTTQHLLRNFFPPLFVSILQKENNWKKKLFFVCMSDMCQ
jgi:hypothetical protein